MKRLNEFKKRFIKDGKLISIPKKEKYKRDMLLYSILLFDSEREYTEAEVNRILAGFYSDYAILRRYLVDGGYLQRDERGLKYEVSNDPSDTES